MKKKILIILSIFISILVSCVKSISEESRFDYILQEVDLVFERFGQCDNITDEIYFSYNESLKGVDVIYDEEKVILEKHHNCMDKLLNLSCEEIAKITSLEKLKEIEDCFEFPLITKKQACIYNQRNFCGKLFRSCGEDKMVGICKDSLETWGSSESPEINFKEDMLDSYCDSTIDKDQKVIDEYDIIIFQCENYTINCDDVQMLDFRNSEWKNSCIEE